MKYQYTEKEFMSVLDGLTGLYNRRQFEISVEQEYNRTKRHPSDFSLAILDIDFFELNLVRVNVLCHLNQCFCYNSIFKV